MLKTLAIISLGASLGAICRWALGNWLNPAHPLLPFLHLGTLTANLLGAFCIGVATALFSALPGLALEWRLLLITGFLGSLTTFSTFTAELGLMLQSGRIWPTLAAIVLHVGGSLLAFFLGIMVFALAHSFLRAAP